MVHEVSDVQARHRCIVNDYMSLSPEARKKTLILSGTNVERLELTADLREALQGEGRLGADVFKMRSLRSLDRTEAQLKYACAYAEGEVVVPVRDYRRYGLKKKAQYTVTGRDIEKNQVTVKAPDGSAITFDPSRCADKTTYAVQEIEIAPGRPAAMDAQRHKARCEERPGGHCRSDRRQRYSHAERCQR